MELISEEVEVVAVQHKEGESKNGKYNFDSLYYNLKNGIQENVVIPQKLVPNMKKGQKVKLKCEIGYKGRINVIDVIN